ncbi:MAG: EF-Tu/IF-2/RF-3 family GTPase [Verrucomicrobiales bacterium]
MVEQIKTVLAAKPLVMTLPIGIENNFVGVVDVLERKAYVWDDSGLPENFEVKDVPEDMVDKVEEYRTEMIETAVEQDDDAMEKALEGEEPDIATIRSVSARAPSIWCSSRPTAARRSRTRALKRPRWSHRLPSISTEVKPQPEVDLEGNETGRFAIVDPKGPLRALAFKIMDDKYGALTFTRIYSGTLPKGTTVLNSFTGKTERVGRIVQMHANSREEVDGATAGDIVALVGLKNVQTGHTLCSEDDPATLEPMVFPDPVISIAVSLKDKALRISSA